MASTIHLYTTTTIYRDVDASQEVRLFTAQESARITNIRWRGASAKRDGRHEHLLVLRLAKEEVGPVFAVSLPIIQRQMRKPLQSSA